MSITAADHEGMRSIVATVKKLDEATGGWTTKAEVRQTGVSLYIKFDKRTDVETAMELVAMLEQSPARLTHLCDEVLAAGLLS
jgi:hypothetical protein